MTAYYNENDPFAAAWLRELIKAGHIAPGVVDERSIEDVTPNELAPHAQCHFFAGIGGWSHALRLAGWPDDKPVWTGSCPCQPFSTAGKGAGFADERHLWPSWFWLISQCQPTTIFGEQVGGKAGRKWLDLVATDLEAAGYAVGAFNLPAASAGAFHIRQRLWFVANANSYGLEAKNNKNGIRHAADRKGCARRSGNVGSERFWDSPRPRGSVPLEVGNGVPASVGRLRGYGNAIVPQVAAEFVSAYMETVSE